MQISINGESVTEVRRSHSLKCPHGGGFWVYAPEHGAFANCTDGGEPLCTCGGGYIVITLADGSTVTVNSSALLMQKLSQLHEADDEARVEEVRRQQEVERQRREQEWLSF